MKVDITHASECVSQFHRGPEWASSVKRLGLLRKSTQRLYELMAEEEGSWSTLNALRRSAAVSDYDFLDVPEFLETLWDWSIERPDMINVFDADGSILVTVYDACIEEEGVREALIQEGTFRHVSGRIEQFEPCLTG